MLSWPCLEPDDSCSTLIHVKGQGLGSGTSAITPSLVLSHTFPHPGLRLVLALFILLFPAPCRVIHVMNSPIFSLAALMLNPHAYIIPTTSHTSHPLNHHQHIIHVVLTGSEYLSNDLFDLSHFVSLFHTNSAYRSTHTTIYCTQITVYPIVLIFTYKPNNQSTNFINLFSHIPFNPLQSCDFISGSSFEFPNYKFVWYVVIFLENLDAPC